MTVAMMMFTALSLIESASIPASLSFRTAEAIQSAAAVSVAPKASPETMDVASRRRHLGDPVHASYGHRVARAPT